jgi:hypothetical protein
MKRASRRYILAAAGAVFLGLFVAASASAVPFNKETRFRFSGAVALPGVVLPAGEYVFELADPTTSRTVVRVRNRERSRVFVQALTRSIKRHPDIQAGTLKLGEAASGTPRRILAWYPEADSYGYEFVY